jgi:hypothetical protein
MKPKSRNFAQLLVVAGAAASVAIAPVAAADPTGTPEAGSESASAPTAWVSVECDEAGD